MASGRGGRARSGEGGRESLGGGRAAAFAASSPWRLEKVRGREPKRKASPRFPPPDPLGFLNPGRLRQDQVIALVAFISGRRRQPLLA